MNSKTQTKHKKVKRKVSQDTEQETVDELESRNKKYSKRLICSNSESVSNHKLDSKKSSVSPKKCINLNEEDSESEEDQELGSKSEYQKLNSHCNKKNVEMHTNNSKSDVDDDSNSDSIESIQSSHSVCSKYKDIKQEDMKTEIVDDENESDKSGSGSNLKHQNNSENNTDDESGKDESENSDDDYDQEIASLHSDSDIDQSYEEGKMRSMFVSSKLSYKPTADERRQLVNMFIKLPHKVLPQHRIERGAGTRSMKLSKRKEFEEYTNLKTGTFSDEEDNIIRRNWKSFCKLHDWNSANPRPFLQMRHKNVVSYLSTVNRKKFVQFLAKGLPDRSLYSVYQRFKILFDPHKVSRYSEEEDKIILNYINQYKCDVKDRKFADLALILKRTRASVWRRYRLLKKKGYSA